MSVAIARPQQKVAGRLDLSVPVLVLIGLFLCVLVLLPLGWLVWYSITDQDGALTFENFLRLALDPAFATPYLTAFEIAAGVALGACAAATPLAWLVARTDLHDPCVCHRFLCHTAVSRRDRLGDPGGA